MRRERASPATSRASMPRENAEEGEFGDQSGFSGGVGGASQAAIGAEELTVPHRLWPRKKKKKACSCIYSPCLLWCVTTQPGSLPGFSSSWKRRLSEHVTSRHNPADWPTLPLAVHSAPQQFQAACFVNSGLSRPTFVPSPFLIHLGSVGSMRPLQ